VNKPFVSFIVMSYMAEKYIQEAINGAFSQTYDNMEIIFSDDASSDRTFEIIEDSVRNYRGKHKVRAYRNKTNIGIGAHINKLWFEIAKGDWIVVSAGDDVSLPHRVEKCMQYASPDVSVIHHGLELIDENSEIITYNDTYAEVLKGLEKKSIEETIRRNLFLIGSSMCLNREMLKRFGPFNADIVNEDNILAYRAQYFGEIIYLADRMIKYRRHADSVSFMPNTLIYPNYIGHIKKNARNMVAIYNQIISDNKILNLSPYFLKEINSKKLKSKIDLFLYGYEGFSFELLLHGVFYSKLIKRILLKYYLALMKNSTKK
jgi:cellulose synthase/poly-beta-1,6-N-acetylglucosamine synthase-like glycosyltransferase